MKKLGLFFAVIAATFLFSCHCGHPTPPGGGNDSTGVQSVSIATADTMITSYLTSINAAQNDTQLHALIFNADSLRSYLNDTGKGKITKVKIMFAQTKQYMATNGMGHNCGYHVGDLTLIIVGYDSKNNYVYDKNGRVMDQGVSCPANCPKSGSAASDVLPQ